LTLAWTANFQTRIVLVCAMAMELGGEATLLNLATSVELITLGRPTQLGRNQQAEEI